MTLIFQSTSRLGDFVLDAAFVSAGGVTALFGKSGSGKTSMIRIIAGLARPDRGQLVLDGEVLVDTERRIFVPLHRRRFGYVFQEPRLFPHLSVRQNLLYGQWFAPKGPRESLAKVVDMLDIGPLLERVPEKLSGGEKQRVAIGRALLSSPRLLLMDEPLAALDEVRKSDLLPYFERLSDEFDINIVYVSHSVAEVARLARQIVMVQDGKVVATGTASQVFSSPIAARSADRREVGAVVEGVVASHDIEHGLTVIRLSAGGLMIPASDLLVGSPVRLHIPARDVMLATQRPLGLSALNIFEGRVGAIGAVGEGMVDVTIDCAGTPILARITGFSRDRLALVEGMPVFAIIKTAALQ